MRKIVIIRNENDLDIITKYLETNKIKTIIEIETFKNCLLQDYYKEIIFDLETGEIFGAIKLNNDLLISEETQIIDNKLFVKNIKSIVYDSNKNINLLE